jgi:hypothetical protein
MHGDSPHLASKVTIFSRHLYFQTFPDRSIWTCMNMNPSQSEGILRVCIPNTYVFLYACIWIPPRLSSRCYIINYVPTLVLLLLQILHVLNNSGFARKARSFFMHAFLNHYISKHVLVHASMLNPSRSVCSVLVLLWTLWTLWTLLQDYTNYW